MHLLALDQDGDPALTLFWVVQQAVAAYLFDWFFACHLDILLSLRII